MSLTTATATPVATPSAATITSTPTSKRGRLVTSLVTLALALGVLVSPQLTGQASAATQLAPATTRAWSYMMLGALNNERRANGLSPLYMSYQLVESAHRHNMDMGAHNTMSHQLPGEAFFANRIGATGYNWRSAGENIGWNGTISMQALYDLEHQMYIETAPDNGHRLNILSRSYRQVGIDVVYDIGHHKLWFTQDFGQLM